MYLRFDTEDLREDPTLNRLLAEYAQARMKLSEYLNHLLDLNVSLADDPAAKKEE